jgi:adenosylcobinamide kinase / adenosylcobinamide-phosphate guanylyltransferase
VALDRGEPSGLSPKAMRTLITGGVKSGKSRHALVVANDFPPPRRFLATAEAFDEEMREKIARHRAERSDRFDTVEEGIDIHERLEERMVLDCLPLWLNNLLHYGREAEFEAILAALIERLPRDIVIVTNEIGMGFVPADPISRRYGVLLGTANARVAAACDRVLLMVAGLPLRVK